MNIFETNLNTKTLNIKDNLNPIICDEGDVLKPEIRERLLEIATQYIEYVGLDKDVEIKDIVLTGSLANYNYSDLSDLDIHIVVEYKDIANNETILMNYFLAKKNLWAEEYDIKVKGFPIEIFVEDVGNVNQEAARYSLANDEWVNKYDKESIKLDKQMVKRKSEEMISKINSLIKDNSDPEAKLIKIDKLKERIRDIRTSGIGGGGEFSTENLAYKVVRNTGFLDKLQDEKIKIVKELLNLKEQTEL